MDFKNKPILAMLHLYGGQKCMEQADDEIVIFEEEGVDGYIVENYGGGIEEVRGVLRLLNEFEKFETMYKGINILPNNFELAFALASVYKLNFIQLDYISGQYVGRSASDTKKIDSYNYEKFRDKFPEIKVLGGVHPKYYTPILGSKLESDIEDAMERCDAIVVTGEGTGKETPLDKIKKFRSIIGNNFPLIIGAGLTESNAEEQLQFANGAIVGSYFKQYGQAQFKVERERVKELMDKVNHHRANTLL
ncbi:MAG: BtpA/SgcQ family protein [Nanoarchaeota archaeon]